MILSGRLYSDEELHEMGVIDLLVPAGDGEAERAQRVRGGPQPGRERAGRVDRQRPAAPGTDLCGRRRDRDRGRSERGRDGR